MKTKKEIELLLRDTTFMPKMYSFEQVRKIVKFHDSEWRKKLKDILKHGHGGGNWRRLIEMALKE